MRCAPVFQELFHLLRLVLKLLRFVNTKILIVVAQALLKACFNLPFWFSATSQGECFATYIASNSHFCSLGFKHVSSPPHVYCGREESFLELYSCALCTFFKPCHHNRSMNGTMTTIQF